MVIVVCQHTKSQFIVGIAMTNISHDVKLDFSDILLVPRFSSLDSRSKVNLMRPYLMPNSNAEISSTGIIAANMDGVGTFEAATILRQYGCMTALHKHYEPERLIRFFNSPESSLSFYSMGISDADYEKFRFVKRLSLIDLVTVDVANGYQDTFYDFLTRLRDEHPHVTIMAGNVVTPEAVIKCYQSGVDIVKMGIGSSAVCTTRALTGIGYPQLSCILDSIQAADECGVYLCSDGGCQVPGDIAKAVWAGADFVMLGSMLAGTDEGGGDVVDGKVMFYGMSSKTANNKHSGGLKNYRSSEGRTTMIPYKGTMESVIEHILGGLRSSCTYVGAKNIAHIPLMTSAIRVNNTLNRMFEQYTVGN